MNKNRIAGMLITAVTLLIVAGVLLGIDIWKKEGNVKQVTLTVDGETRERLSVSLTDFYPGGNPRIRGESDLSRRRQL